MSLCVDKTGQPVELSPDSGNGYWSQIMQCSTTAKQAKESRELYQGMPTLYRDSVAMLVLYEDSGLTLEEIGQAFGGVHKGRVLRKIRHARAALSKILDGAADGTEIASRLREARLSKGRDYKTLTDSEWDAIEHHMPPPRSSWERQEFPIQRAVINGVLWRVQTGRQWLDLPPQFTNKWRCSRLYLRLLQSGVWDDVRAALPGRDL